MKCGNFELWKKTTLCCSRYVLKRVMCRVWPRDGLSFRASTGRHPFWLLFGSSCIVFIPGWHNIEAGWAKSSFFRQKYLYLKLKVIHFSQFFGAGNIISAIYTNFQTDCCYTFAQFPSLKVYFHSIVPFCMWTIECYQNPCILLFSLSSFDQWHSVSSISTHGSVWQGLSNKKAAMMSAPQDPISK